MHLHSFRSNPSKIFKTDENDSLTTKKFITLFIFKASKRINYDLFIFVTFKKCQLHIVLLKIQYYNFESLINIKYL